MSSNYLMIAVTILMLPAADITFAQTGAHDTARTNGFELTRPSLGDSDSENNVEGPVGDIKQAQQALKDEGLYSGPIDGELGAITKQAIEQFQEMNGLKQTAELDPQTQDQLERADND